MNRGETHTHRLHLVAAIDCTESTRFAPAVVATVQRVGDAVIRCSITHRVKQNTRIDDIVDVLIQHHPAAIRHFTIILLRVNARPDAPLRISIAFIIIKPEIVRVIHVLDEGSRVIRCSQHVQAILQHIGVFPARLAVDIRNRR